MTQQAGSVLILPPGFLLAEKAENNAPVLGLRAAFLTKDLEWVFCESVCV